MAGGFLIEPCPRLAEPGLGLVEPGLCRPAVRDLLLHPFAHLLVGVEVFPGLRVVKSQAAICVEPHLEPERFAVQAVPAVDQGNRRQRPVLAFVQAKPLQARREPVPRGVEQPVLRDAQGGKLSSPAIPRIGASFLPRGRA